MIDGYRNMFEEKPNTIYKSPLERGDHPKMGKSEFLKEDGVQKYQYLIGSIQWTVSVGRMNDPTAVMAFLAIGPYQDKVIWNVQREW